MGHTMSIHSRSDDVILEFGLKKPAFRIVVNTPTTLGSIGFTTGLDPSMTLGCGGWGGNITSDNISPKHLLNIKRLAYETSLAPASTALDGGAHTGGTPADQSRPGGNLPKAPAPARVPGGLAAESLARRIDQFLASRGYTPPSGHPTAPAGPEPERAAPPAAHPVISSSPVEKPADFVCEDDVRQAVRQNRKIVIGERTIVTPAARDLAEQHKVFVQAAWPR
jgi:acetaldehyde dehydrogenase (acetylating)